MADWITQNPNDELNKWIAGSSSWGSKVSDEAIQDSMIERQRRLDVTNQHKAALADRARREAENASLNTLGNSLGVGNLGMLNWDRTGPVSAKDLVTIATSAGRITVNKQAANDFKNFINEVERRGYDIKSLGGYNPRKIRGGDLWSMHSGGYAIDINPGSNPHTGKLITDMPSWMVSLGRKYNLYWGGNWKNSKDPMHWSWGYSG